MEKPNKRTTWLAGFLGLALIAGLAMGAWGWGLSSVSAAPTSPTTSGSPAATASQPAGATDGRSVEDRLLDSFMGKFTSRLGVDEAKLNAAFTGAVNDTVDQAVRDGTIRQDQADEVRSKAQSIAQKGLRALLLRGFSAGDEPAKSEAEMQANPKAAIVAAMDTLGIPVDEVQRGLESGKSLVDVAGAHNVDAQRLKTTILNTYKSQLDTAVRNGTLTQAQADRQYQAFAQEVDSIINGKGRVGDKGANRPEIDAPTEAAERAAWNAAPALLGMQAVEIKQALGSEGKSLTDLARAKNVDPQRLHDAMLSAGKAQLDSAVTAKTLTQAQADAVYVTLTAWVDGLMQNGAK
jgi:ribosomal protein S20